MHSGTKERPSAGQPSGKSSAWGRLTCISLLALVAVPGLAQDASAPAGLEPLKPPPLPIPPPAPVGVPVPPPSAAPVIPADGDAGRVRVYGPLDPNARPVGPAPAGIPLPLASAVGKATSDYPSVRASVGAVRIAEKDTKAAKWLRFPSASLQGLGFQGGNANASRGNLGLDVTIDQPLYTFGRISNNIKRAEAAEDVARGQLGETRQNVALQTAAAYYQMVLTSRFNDIMLAGRDALAKLAESIDRRVEQQVSPAADRIQAQARIANLEAEIEANQGQFFSARSRFRQFTGDPEATLTDVPVYNAATAHPPSEGAMEEAQACDPKRQRLLAETDVAAAQAKVARSQLFPQISAQFQQSEILGTRAGVVLRAQTSGGLSGLSAAQSAQLRAENSKLLVDVNDREAREALSQDLIENLAARGKIAANADAAIATRDTAESYRNQFIAGRRSWLDVINAEREALNAQLGVADSEVSAMFSATRILLRTCRWQP